MTNETLETFQELNDYRQAQRQQRLLARANLLLTTLREDDRIIGKDNQDRAQLRRQRPAVKKGKHVRRDPAMNAADVAIDLERAIVANDFQQIRRLLYQLSQITGMR